MSFPTYTQDPQDRLDYEIDWSEWLPAGDTIIGSTWEASDAAIILEDDEITNSETAAVVFISGGVVGQSYTVTNHMETGQGRKKDQTLKIKIKTQ